MRTWQLPTLMAQRGITSIPELQARLDAVGAHRSRSALFRLVDHPPNEISIALLHALCAVLACTPNDLLLDLPTRTGPLPFPAPEPIVLLRRRS